jgi:hypothetical protein
MDPLAYRQRLAIILNTLSVRSPKVAAPSIKKAVQLLELLLSELSESPATADPPTPEDRMERHARRRSNTNGAD